MQKQKYKRTIAEDALDLVCQTQILEDLESAVKLAQIANLEKDVEIIAEYLRAAIYNLERILGKVDIEDVLGEIFSSFCIGK